MKRPRKKIRRREAEALLRAGKSISHLAVFDTGPRAGARVVQLSKCSEEARYIANQTGLDPLEVEELLRAGRTAEELLVLGGPGE